MAISPRHNAKFARLGEVALYLVAIGSLTYAVATAPQAGKDLATFRDMGEAWAEGIHQNKEEGTFYGPPPYAAVLFYPLSLLPFETCRVLFLALNLLAIPTTVLSVIQLYGAHWPLRAALFLCAFFLTLAPTRVTLRVGQISLLVTALLLGSLVAGNKQQKLLSGALLGLSLCKYPLTLPFVLYFLWRKEWKIVATALLTVAALTEVFAFRLGLSPLEVTSDYVRVLLLTSTSSPERFAGVTEFQPLLVALTGDQSLANWLNIVAVVVALILMVLVFKLKPQYENLHLAIVTFFSLWFAYHRIYDAVICILPAAIYVDLWVRGRFRRFAAGSLIALGLLAISIPGLLTERLHLEGDSLSENPAGFVALHIERILVFILFWLLLVFLWRGFPTARAVRKEQIAVAH